jgi:glycosyltransferase involved in cell wall biosynthesis
MSLATLEAMATGLPVVLTEGSGLEELVDGNGLTFAVGDVPALAAALEQLMTSEPLRRQMGERGRQIAQRISWEQVGQTYYELLCSVAADSTIQKHL